MEGPQRTNLCAIWMLLAVFLAVKVHGSTITLARTPTVIQPILSPSLTLRCAVNASVQVSPSGSLVGRRSVSTSADAVQTLFSLVILRNGIDVASLSSASGSVTILKDKDSLSGIGGIPGNAGELGYIELTWVYPDEAQSGNYSCEANGFTTVGHPVRLLTSEQVPVKTPQLNDLVKYIHDQQVELSRVKINNANLTKIVNDLDTKLKQQCENGTVVDQEQSKKLNEQEKINVAMAAELSAIKQTINASYHTETGSSVCVGSWTTVGNYQRSPDITVTFNTTYDTPPVVLLSVQGMYYEHTASSSSSYQNYQRYRYVEYHVELKSVNTTGFVYSCKIRQNDSRFGSFYMHNLNLTWVSMFK